MGGSALAVGGGEVAVAGIVVGGSVALGLEAVGGTGVAVGPTAEVAVAGATVLVGDGSGTVAVDSATSGRAGPPPPVEPGTMPG